MTTKQWKEKIAEQKRLDMQRRQDLMRRRLCIKDTNVVVEMGELYVKNEELEELIEEILKVTRGCTLKVNEVFKLSSYCDCMFDLKFLGINKEKVLLFKLI
jgi:hypothetical protein